MNSRPANLGVELTSLLAAFFRDELAGVYTDEGPFWNLCSGLDTPALLPLMISAAASAGREWRSNTYRLDQLDLCRLGSTSLNYLDISSFDALLAINTYPIHTARRTATRLPALPYRRRDILDRSVPTVSLPKSSETLHHSLIIRESPQIL